MTSLAFDAMCFARTKHAGQVRKYTGNPYADHLAEVAGIVAAVGLPNAEFAIATAWLHDYVEDIDPHTGDETLHKKFGHDVSMGVWFLTDRETGTRAERKAKACERLALAPRWVQTIKCADLLSNTASIVRHDPKFAVVYLKEKRAALDVMTRAHAGLRELAYDQCEVLR